MRLSHTMFEIFIKENPKTLMYEVWVWFPYSQEFHIEEFDSEYLAHKFKKDILPHLNEVLKDEY